MTIKRLSWVNYLAHLAVVNYYLEQALKLATQIIEKSPVAVNGSKHILNYSRDHTVSEGLDYVALWNASMLNTQVSFQSFAYVFQSPGRQIGHPRLSNENKACLCEIVEIYSL